MEMRQSSPAMKARSSPRAAACANSRCTARRSAPPTPVEPQPRELAPPPVDGRLEVLGVAVAQGSREEDELVIGGDLRQPVRQRQHVRADAGRPGERRPKIERDAGHEAGHHIRQAVLDFTRHPPDGPRPAAGGPWFPPGGAA